MILIGAAHSLHFDAIKEAAQLQFPDHRPTPQVVYVKEFDTGSWQEGKPDPGKAYGKMCGRRVLIQNGPRRRAKGKTHNTFVTEK